MKIKKKKKVLYKNYTINPTDFYEKWGSVGLSHGQFLLSCMILQPLNINGWAFHKKGLHDLSKYCRTLSHGWQQPSLLQLPKHS